MDKPIDTVWNLPAHVVLALADQLTLADVRDALEARYGVRVGEEELELLIADLEADRQIDYEASIDSSVDADREDW